MKGPTLYFAPWSFSAFSRGNDQRATWVPDQRRGLDRRLERSEQMLCTNAEPPRKEFGDDEFFESPAIFEFFFKRFFEECPPILLKSWFTQVFLSNIFRVFVFYIRVVYLTNIQVYKKKLGANSIFSSVNS